MPIVPMKQEITVERGSTINREGKAIPDITFPLRCRVDEGSYLVQHKTTGTIGSETVVATLKILLDKLADIHYSDVIIYQNELNATIKGKPKKINVKRSLNGKPVLTEVFL